jgi:hypothetical protein
MKNFNFFRSGDAPASRGLKFLMTLGLIFVTVLSFGQRIVQVPSGTELSSVILGDTTDDGDRVDVNTIYELEKDGLYPVAKEISLKTMLHIRGAQGEGALPAIYAQKDASNNWPKVINTKGDVILENLYLSNANGPEANPKWGGFRVGGTKSRVILSNCQFEYDKASTIQLRADSIKVYMYNCVAAKTGNYAAYNGNGRLVDTRGYYTDTIVIDNVTAYYMQDRIIRNMGGEINYLKINHLTVVNNGGMHGCIAMAKVHHAVITNNLIINGMYQGDWPNDPEQTGPLPDRLHIYMITMDTVYDDMQLEIHHNNFAFTDTLVNYFNTIDSVGVPQVLAPLVAKTLGDDSVNAFFQEPVEFNNMPDIPWDYLRAIYTDPQPSPMPNNWPDNIGIANIDAGYASSYTSYSASDQGEPLGDLNWFDEFTRVPEVSSNVGDVSIYPNPVRGDVTFRYTLKRPSDITLSIYNITGQRVVSLEQGFQNEGIHTVRWNVSELKPGLYFYTLGTRQDTQRGKMIVIR